MTVRKYWFFSEETYLKHVLLVKCSYDKILVTQNLFLKKPYQFIVELKNSIVALP